MHHLRHMRGLTLIETQRGNEDVFRSRVISYRSNFLTGFTLVEVVVVVAMFTILSLAVTSTIVQFYKTNSYAVSQTSAVQSGSRGLELTVRDIREATFADDGAFPIVDASPHRFSFFSDIDRDDSVELIVYDLVGTTLEKTVTNATGTPPMYPSTSRETHTVSEYVRNTDQGVATFTYYDNTGTEVDGSDVTAITSVEVTIVVNVDPNRNPGLFTLTSRATVRNLKNNL